MQKWLKKEKELRGKGIADKQIEETVAFLRQKGIDTVWDVQAAYDSSLFGLRDRCSFGSNGLCCRNCNLGPCRLGGSPYVINMLTKELENTTGSTLIIEIDPKESAKAMINHIQKKRKELGI